MFRHITFNSDRRCSNHPKDEIPTSVVIPMCGRPDAFERSDWCRKSL